MISEANSDLVEEIRALQADRQKHAEAIAAIDAVLSRIGQTLTAIRPAGEPASSANVSSVGSGIANPPPNPAYDAPYAPLPPTQRPRKYRKLALTGDEFVLELIRQRGAPTTHEINREWRAQGRGGVANNVIGRLLKQGLIVRETLADQRGSRYRLSSAPQESGADASANGDSAEPIISDQLRST
jgi:hypothetical protein